jgi:DNA-directed RNA polymerase specialized sigma24 family protein
MVDEIKRMILLKLAPAPNTPTGSAPSPRTGSSNGSDESISARIELLTPQERHVFRLCFQSGVLTYREIAEHLDITQIAAKNLVNRLFQSELKRSLFAKEYQHGAARVTIGSGVRRKILAGATRSRKPTQPVTFAP